MYISTSDWKNYIDKLSKLNKGAADAIIAYVQKNGFGNTDELVSYAYNVVQTYGNGSAALAAAMYDATAEAAGKFYDPAEPAPLPEYGDVAKTVYGTLKTSQNVNEMAGAVSRLVKKAGADTMIYNVSRYNKKYGKKKNTGAQFAWVPVGDTCPFCLMLASSGWRNQTVGGKDHAEHIHSNCDCNYAVRFDDRSGVAGYDPDQYKEMFDGVEGDTWNEKVNAMRRKQYEKDKDRINAKKRETYALRKNAKGLAAGKGNKDIPPHDKPVKLDKLLDGDDRRKVLLKHEQDIANEPIENAIVITKDGEIFRCFGDINGVYPDYDLGEKLIGADVTHNHPIGSDNEYTFSARDVQLFLDNELSSLRGIDELYIYELDWDSDNIDDPLVDILNAGEHSIRHNEIISYAKQFGFGYRRKLRDK